MKQIAVIDDDVTIGDMLQRVLEKEGYGVLRAYSGTEAVLLLSQGTRQSQPRPDLVLLDLMLPGLSGEEVLSQIREIPVIVVSAKGEVEHKVETLLGGAQDYITKPFNLGELLARIAVVLRRVEGGQRQEVLSCCGLTLEEESRRVLVEGEPVRLTKTEFAILKLLLRNPGQVLTKSRILEEISRDTPDCVESSLKVHISNLRGKLREKAPEKEHIEAVWGIGFRLRTEE